MSVSNCTDSLSGWKHPVAYSMWEGDRGKLSLFQCRSVDFGSPSGDEPERIKVRDVAINQQLDTVMIWTNETATYVMVAEPKSALDYVKLRASKNKFRK